MSHEINIETIFLAEYEQADVSWTTYGVTKQRLLDNLNGMSGLVCY